MIAPVTMTKIGAKMIVEWDRQLVNRARLRRLQI
jgi:hypothetical protein